MYIAWIIVFGRDNNATEDGGNFWHVLFELFDGFAEVCDFGAFKRDEGGKDAVEVFGFINRDAGNFRSVLNKHCGFGVFKEDVVVGVSFGEFLLYFVVKVVCFVLAFPISPRLS